MPKSIALTGATGFTGRHVVAELLRRGHGVKALVRNPAAAKLPADVQLITGDLAAADALADLAQSADAVIHLAGAITGLSVRDYFSANEDGAAAVALAAQEAGVARFIHVSSLAARQPHISSYAASKAAGERAVREAFGSSGLLVVRPSAIYGPGDRASLPLVKALSGGWALVPGRPISRFSLIHVTDVARSLSDAVESDETGLIEISDGVSGGYGWEDLARIAAGVVGRPVKPLYLPRPFVAAIALLAEIASRMARKPSILNRGKVAELYHPDWVAAISGLAPRDSVGFAEGFAATLAWYREAQWLPRPRGADRTSPKPRNESRP